MLGVVIPDPMVTERGGRGGEVLRVLSRRCGING
jgi:hypothetical protein